MKSYMKDLIVSWKVFDEIELSYKIRFTYYWDTLNYILFNKKAKELLNNSDDELMNLINLRIKTNNGIVSYLKRKEVLDKYSWQRHAKGIWFTNHTSWKERLDMIKRL